MGRSLNVSTTIRQPQAGHLYFILTSLQGYCLNAVQGGVSHDHGERNVNFQPGKIVKAPLFSA